MGYCLRWELNYDQNCEKTCDSVEALKKISNYGWHDGDVLYEAKWYDWEDDVKTFLEHHNDVSLTIDVEGEEQGDVWRIHIENGKYAIQHAELIWKELEEKDWK